MGGALFFLLVELLRRFLVAMAWGAVLVAPLLVLFIFRLLKREAWRRWRPLLWASLGVPVMLAAAGVFWLRFDGGLGEDRSLATLSPGVGAIHALAASEDGGWVFVGSASGSVALCTFGPPAACRRFEVAEFENVTAVDVSADGRFFAAMTVLCTLAVWERFGDSLALLHRTHYDASGCSALEFSGSPPYSLYASWLTAFSATGPARASYGNPLYAIASRTGKIEGRIGEPVAPSHPFVASGTYYTDLPIHVERVADLSTRAGEALVASASWDGTVKLWDAGTASLAGSVGHDNLWLTAIALGPSGVVAGREDGRLAWWSRREGEPDCILDAHTGDFPGPFRSVNAVAYSTELGLVASGANGRRVVVSDPERCTIVDRLPGHRRAVMGLAFVDGGRRLVSAGMDGSVKLWSVPPPG